MTFLSELEALKRLVLAVNCSDRWFVSMPAPATCSPMCVLSLANTHSRQNLGGNTIVCNYSIMIKHSTGLPLDEEHPNRISCIVDQLGARTRCPYHGQLLQTGLHIAAKSAECCSTFSGDFTFKGTQPCPKIRRSGETLGHTQRHFKILLVYINGMQEQGPSPERPYGHE